MMDYLELKEDVIVKKPFVEKNTANVLMLALNVHTFANVDNV